MNGWWRLIVCSTKNAQQKYFFDIFHSACRRVRVGLLFVEKCWVLLSKIHSFCSSQTQTSDSSSREAEKAIIFLHNFRCCCFDIFFHLSFFSQLAELCCCVYKLLCACDNKQENEVVVCPPKREWVSEWERVLSNYTGVHPCEYQISTVKKNYFYSFSVSLAHRIMMFNNQCRSEVSNYFWCCWGWGDEERRKKQGISYILYWAFDFDFSLFVGRYEKLFLFLGM